MDSCWRICFDGNYLLTTFTHRFISVFCLCVSLGRRLGDFFCKYFYKSVTYLIKGITFAYTKTRNKMKTTITYSVSDLMSFKTWEQAIAFANRINYKFIKVTGTKGAKQVEKGYTIDTWKNAKQIKNDIIFEL